MPLLLLWHPQKASGGPAETALAIDGAGQATLTGAAIATADISIAGAGETTFGGAAISTADIVSDGQAQTEFVAAAIAEAAIMVAAAATLEMEGVAEGGTTIESGAFSFVGEASATFVVKKAPYRPAWWHRLKRRPEWLKESHRLLEIQEDDEEVMALVPTAAAVTDRQDAIRALRA